jgi:hypothetical protein
MGTAFAAAIRETGGELQLMSRMGPDPSNAPWAPHVVRSLPNCQKSETHAKSFSNSQKGRHFANNLVRILLEIFAICRPIPPGVKS